MHFRSAVPAWHAVCSCCSIQFCDRFCVRNKNGPYQHTLAALFQLQHFQGEVPQLLFLVTLGRCLCLKWLKRTCKLKALPHRKVSAQLLSLPTCAELQTQSPGAAMPSAGSSAVIIYHRGWNGFFVRVILARRSLGDPSVSAHVLPRVTFASRAKNPPGNCM